MTGKSSKWLNASAFARVATEPPLGQSGCRSLNRILHFRSGGRVSRPFTVVVSSSSHPSTPMGSKAGATFCLAMISISSGMKTCASQRCRNNLFFRLNGKWGPAKLFGEPQRPPPWCVRGRGDGERSHGLKLNYGVILSYARMTAS
jgi:hypothetical protein